MATHSRFDLDTAAADAYPVTLTHLLTEMVSLNGSDLHLRAGEPPIYRIHGHLGRRDYPVLTSDVIKGMAFSIMNEELRFRFEENLEVDLAHQVSGVARFRVNVFHQQKKVGAVMRQIPVDIQGIDDLKLPAVLKEIALLPRGLVLVTGPTGSGKSTTLAAMIKHVNERRARHIVTIEDPIEFVHEDIKSLINQRELGEDTHSFANSLKSALREDPDVILIGEMRDLETIEMAITSAETGHLVFGTLHTTDAVQTVDRIIDVFPVYQQQQIRLQMASNLVGVVSQTLLKRSDETSRVAAYEVMNCTNAVRSQIREGKTHQVESLISVGSRHGMQTLNQHLAQLVAEKVCNRIEAIEKSPHPDELSHLIEQESAEKAKLEAEAARRRR